MSGAIQVNRPTTLKRYFVGFSTQNSNRNGVRTLYDIDLINADLMASFQTRIGERVMRPDYGCRLWDYLMEPLTAGLRDTINDEVLRICSLDSRVIPQQVTIFEIEKGFRIEATLEYLPWRVISTFTMTFENADSVYFS